MGISIKPSRQKELKTFTWCPSRQYHSS